MPEELLTIKNVMDLVGGPGLAVLIVVWLLWFVTWRLWLAVREAGSMAGALIDRAVVALELLSIVARELVDVQRSRSPDK
jgi:hypothetical protein